jgi:hypothetical protein
MKTITGNTPHLEKKLLSICCSYLWGGLNCFVLGIYEIHTRGNPLALLLGVLLWGMVPISLIDDRKSMRSLSAVVAAEMVHMAVTAIIYYDFSLSTAIAVYVIETILSAAIISIFHCKKDSKEKKTERRK